MPLRKQISKQVACILLLGMYVSFLCFQVTYNLAIARKNQPLATLKFSANLQSDDSDVSPSQKHAGLIAKVKAAPSKRFYQKIEPLLPAVINFPKIFFAPESFVEYEIVSTAKVHTQCPQQRGPPSFS